MFPIASRKKECRKRPVTLHPDEPWLSRKDWADGKINSSDKVAVLCPVAFALFWNFFPAFMRYGLRRAERLLPKDQMLVVFCDCLYDNRCNAPGLGVGRSPAVVEVSAVAV